MKPMEELSTIAHLLPLEVLQDIRLRVGDWMASGGKDDDPYIHQQLNFAKRFIK